MGSDDIVKKKMVENRKLRQERKSNRNSKIRNQIPKVLILTEGKSEKIYFDKIKEILTLNTLDVIQSEYTDSNGIIKEAVRKAKKSQSDGDEYTFIFCIFDLDTVKNIEYLTVIEKSRLRDTKIIPIYTFPCIEVWFILHYEVCTKPFHSMGKKSIGDTVKNYLKERFEATYSEANEECIRSFAEDYKRAIYNSTQLVKLQTEVDSINPISTIHQLILFLENVKLPESNHIFERTIEELIEAKI
jgi:hypothetical protein